MRLSTKRHEGLEGMFASIWSSVVHPIVKALALKVRMNPILLVVSAQPTRSPLRRGDDPVSGGA
jgi:hypothetical protein